MSAITKSHALKLIADTPAHTEIHNKVLQDVLTGAPTTPCGQCSWEHDDVSAAVEVGTRPCVACPVCCTQHTCSHHQNLIKLLREAGYEFNERYVSRWDIIAAENFAKNRRKWLRLRGWMTELRNCARILEDPDPNPSGNEREVSQFVELLKAAPEPVQIRKDYTSFYRIPRDAEKLGNALCGDDAARAVRWILTFTHTNRPRFRPRDSKPHITPATVRNVLGEEPSLRALRLLDEHSVRELRQKIHDSPRPRPLFEIERLQPLFSALRNALEPLDSWLLREAYGYITEAILRGFDCPMESKDNFRSFRMLAVPGRHSEEIVTAGFRRYLETGESYI